MTEFDQGDVSVAATDIFFANGGEDPWRWATKQFSDEAHGQISVVSDCNDCGHCAELYTPTDADPEELTQTRLMVADWVDDLLARSAAKKQSKKQATPEPPV